MCGKRHPPDSPLEWLNRARSDLQIAGSDLMGVYLEDLCYHAQQAAEKALKAVLLYYTGSFPYIHDLAELVFRIQQAGITVPQSICDAVALTEYAVEGRYPSFDEPTSREQRDEAVAQAQCVLEWSETLIGNI
ncbi:MAG: HEPN domain-containing protein [Coprothermobacterota bacterium]|nr:HEPN domain-containing protein [Coprothermobacterota bacterium]